MANNEIPYKIYLTENEMPTYWYNLRADMKNKPAPLLNPGTHQPMTAAELSGVFCDELVQQELDNDTREYPVPQEILDFYRMYRPSPLVRAYCLEKKLQTYLEINQGKNKTESDVQKVKTNPAPVKEAIITKTGKDTRQPVTAEELKKASLTAKSQTQRASSDMPEQVKETALLLTPNDYMLVLEQEGYEEKDTFAEVYPAMRVDRGFLKSGLEQNRAEEIVLRNPYILLTDDHLDIFSAQKLLNDVEAAGRDLLLIAEEENGLPAAILSDPKNKVKIAVVKPASYGDRKIEILRDLAVFTNGTAIITKDGMSLEKTNRNMLESKMGSATTVIVRQQETFIINANRKEALVTKRVDEIKAAIAKSYSDFDKEKMTERLHNLQGRAAVFWVSGRTEARKKVKREDLEDCIKAYQEKQRAEEEKKKSEKAYSEGLQLVLKKEYTKAFPLFKQAAEEGHAGAQHQLGKLYMAGNGVKRSPQEAIKWYRKAAEAGDKDAQYWLGYYYQSGCEGLHKNLEEARRWFKMSADQGEAGAKYALEKVEAQLQTRRTCPVCGCVSENRNTTICPVCGSNMK